MVLFSVVFLSGQSLISLSGQYMYNEAHSPLLGSLHYNSRSLIQVSQKYLSPLFELNTCLLFLLLHDLRKNNKLSQRQICDKIWSCHVHCNCQIPKPLKRNIFSISMFYVSISSPIIFILISLDSTCITLKCLTLIISTCHFLWLPNSLSLI